jgi:hypothetical protein
MAASAPPSAPGYVTAAPMRNGLGIAALCCGLVGILVGLVPLMFLASSALGVVAIVFGMIGIRRISRGEASNRAIAIAGLATGVAAFALSLAGLTIVTMPLAGLPSPPCSSASGWKGGLPSAPT